MRWLWIAESGENATFFLMDISKDLKKIGRVEG
jgi:hypothetical protein